MFTGIIEATAKVLSIESKGSTISFWIESSLAALLKIDESVSHNGVCLTIEEKKDNSYRVTAVKETIDKTDLATWKADSLVNLERAMLMNGRLDGHIVQGHVDATVKCIEVKECSGSIEFTFTLPAQFRKWMIEKGSVCINGVSLTVYNVTDNSFTVTIIPYTFTHTGFQYVQVGDVVNVEFDVIGKYVEKIISGYNLSIEKN
ncbi:riboflavin synthase [soil metagenome]